MRKPLIVIMSIIFTGALLIYTAQANLNLLQQVYVNPQYVIFGMLALEGGVLYWLGYYLLHWNANHKAIALTMVVIDFILSMIGFFMDLNLRTGDQIKTALPPILIVFQSLTGFTGHLARAASCVGNVAALVSIPNGLHRPFSHRYQSGDQALC